MDFQLFNLGVGLVGVVGVAITLAILFIIVGIAIHYIHKSGGQETPKEVYLGLPILWVLCMVIITIATVSSNAPKIIVKDAYEGLNVEPSSREIQNLEPRKLTDDERLEKNRKLIEENLIE